MKLPLNLTLVIILGLTTLSCTRSYITPPQNEEIVRIKEKIVKIQKHVPEEYLRPCSWVVQLTKPTQAELASVNIKNQKIFEDCYYRHNAFIDWHKGQEN